MTCTYCGHDSHTAPRCPRRPRLKVAPVALAMAVAATLGACAGKDVPVAVEALAPPSADLMVPPEPLPDVPACEGQPQCRAAYYTQSRAQYGRLADRTRGLQRYVNTIRAKGKAKAAD